MVDREVGPINFGKYEAKERAELKQKAEDWLNNHGFLELNEQWKYRLILSWTTSEKVDANDVDLNRKKRKFIIDALKKDKYEVVINGEVIGKFDKGDEWQAWLAQYLYDMFDEYTEKEANEIKMTLLEEAIQSDMAELADDILNVDTDGQTVYSLEDERKKLEEDNKQSNEETRERKKLLREQMKNMNLEMKELKDTQRMVEVQKNIEEILLLQSEANTLYEHIKWGTLPIDLEENEKIATLEEAEALLRKKAVTINALADEVVDLYASEWVDSSGIQSSLDLINTDMRAILSTFDHKKTPDRPTSSSRRSTVEASRTANVFPKPFDITVLQRYGGQPAEEYFASLWYDQSHMSLLKAQLGPKKFNEKMEKAAEELVKFHQKAYEIQQEYLTQWITIPPFTLATMKKTPDEYKKAKEMIIDLQKHNAEIYKLTLLKDKRDAIAPFNPDLSVPTRATERWETIVMGNTMLPNEWANYYGAKYINEALISRWHPWVWTDWEKYLFGLTGKNSPKDVIEYMIQQDKVAIKYHYDRMNAQQLIALYNVAENYDNFDEQNEKILKRTLIKRLLWVATAWKIQDRWWRDVANPFADMVILLWSKDGNPGTLEKGKERFWTLLKESYIDEKYGDSIESDVNAEFTRLKAIADAVHGQELQNKNLHLVADQMWFENPISEDALLTNAFIKVMSQKLEIPQRNIKMIFSLNKKDPYETASEIRSVMKIDAQDVPNWKVFLQKWASRWLRHSLYQQVAKGNMKLSTADKMANGIEIVTSLWKVITWWATLWSLGKSIFHWVSGSLKRAFTLWKWDYKKNFDAAFKNLKAAWVRWIAYAGLTALDSWTENFYDEFMPDWLQEYGDIAYNQYRKKMHGDEMILQQTLESWIGTNKIPLDYLVGKSVSWMKMQDLLDKGILIQDNNQVRIDKDVLLNQPWTEWLRWLLDTQWGETKLRLLLNYISERIIQNYWTRREDVVNHPSFESLIFVDAVNTVPKAPEYKGNLPSGSESTDSWSDDTSSPVEVESSTETTESTLESNAVLDAELRAIGLGKTQTEIEAMSADEKTEYYAHSAFAMQQWHKLLDDSSDTFNTYFDMDQLEVAKEDGTTEKITVNNFRGYVEDALDQTDVWWTTAKDALKQWLEKVIAWDDDAVKKYFDLIAQIFGADESYSVTWSDWKVLPLYSSKKQPAWAKSLAAYLADPKIGNSNSKWTLYSESPTLWKGKIGSPAATVWSEVFDSSQHNWTDLL